MVGVHCSLMMNQVQYIMDESEKNQINERIPMQAILNIT